MTSREYDRLRELYQTALRHWGQNSSSSSPSPERIDDKGSEMSRRSEDGIEPTKGSAGSRGRLGKPGFNGRGRSAASRFKDGPTRRRLIGRLPDSQKRSGACGLGAAKIDNPGDSAAHL
jgi:hypothetical protein